MFRNSLNGSQISMSKIFVQHFLFFQNSHSVVAGIWNQSQTLLTLIFIKVISLDLVVGSELGFMSYTVSKPSQNVHECSHFLRDSKRLAVWLLTFWTCKICATRFFFFQNHSCSSLKVVSDSSQFSFHELQSAMAAFWRMWAQPKTSENTTLNMQA